MQTRPVALLPAMGQTLHMSRTTLIWPSRPQSSHIGSTMGLAANRTCGGRCHSCLPTLSQSWDESWQKIRWPAPRMSSRSESTAAFSSDAVTASSFYDATYAVFSQIREPHAVRVRLGSLHVAPSHSGSLRVPMSSAWHVFPHWINNAGSQNSR